MTRNVSWSSGSSVRLQATTIQRVLALYAGFNTGLTVWLRHSEAPLSQSWDARLRLKREWYFRYP